MNIVKIHYKKFTLLICYDRYCFIVTLYFQLVQNLKSVLTQLVKEHEQGEQANAKKLEKVGKIINS